jgi:hypothetical protein
MTKESAEELSVAYSGGAEFQKGQVLQLHTKNGSWEVEVVWIIGGTSGSDTLLGLQPNSSLTEITTSRRSFANLALVGIVACGLLLAAKHFGTDWSSGVLSFVQRLFRPMLP